MIDIIVTHPRDVLYPWWMQAMNQNRDLFNKLIVVMTQSATHSNFTNYLKANLKGVEVIEEFPYDGKDWRNSAIEMALKKSYGTHVLFLEQDFLFKPGFLEKLIKQAEEWDAIGFRDGQRFHPACLLVSKDFLDKTSKDFSFTTQYGDHFAKLTHELDSLCYFGNEYKINSLDEGDWYHLAGLTQNYRLESKWYQPQVFFEYNKLSQDLPQHNSWKQFCIQKQGQMGELSPDPEISLKEYFV